MPKESSNSVDLRDAFRVWAKKRDLRPIELKKAMGWSYNYAWGMLHGLYRFGPQSWGAFASVYGTEELQEIFRIGKYEPKGGSKT